MSRHQKGGGDRGVRVAEQMHHELAELIRGELKDPRVGMVTVTGVDLTPDYAYANVHYTVLPSDPETLVRTQEGLQRAAGFLRSQLFRRVRVHTTPTLRFVHDRSTEYGIEMSRLIAEANSRKGADE